MDPLAVVSRLGRIAPRAAAGDGERRAAVWLRDQLRAAGRDSSLQTIWVRPRWELAAALGVALALAARLRRLARGHLSSATAILTADVAGLVAVAAIRAAGTGGAVVSIAQFALTAVLVIALAALLDIALADVSPGANVNASGVAV